MNRKRLVIASALFFTISNVLALDQAPLPSVADSTLVTCVEPHPPVVWKDLNGLERSLKKVCELSAETPEETRQREVLARAAYLKAFGEPLPDAPALTEEISEPNAQLTAFDRALIREYTRSLFKKLNPYLREEEKANSDLVPLADSLNQALSKLPDFRGITYRGAFTFPTKALLNYRVGAVVPDPAFYSTSRILSVAEDASRAALFVIRSKTGKEITRWSAMPHEREILFRTGTRFKVLSNVAGSKKGRLIELEEVSD